MKAFTDDGCKIENIRIFSFTFKRKIRFKLVTTSVLLLPDTF